MAATLVCTMTLYDSTTRYQRSLMNAGAVARGCRGGDLCFGYRSGMTQGWLRDDSCKAVWMNLLPWAVPLKTMKMVSFMLHVSYHDFLNKIIFLSNELSVPLCSSPAWWVIIGVCRDGGKSVLENWVCVITSQRLTVCHWLLPQVQWEIQGLQVSKTLLGATSFSVNVSSPGCDSLSVFKPRFSAIRCLNSPLGPINHDLCPQPPSAGVACMHHHTQLMGSILGRRLHSFWAWHFLAKGQDCMHHNGKGVCCVMIFHELGCWKSGASLGDLRDKVWLPRICHLHRWQ
jgi:hypothetical protein